jgi:hypothetical protein
LIGDTLREALPELLPQAASRLQSSSKREDRAAKPFDQLSSLGLLLTSVAPSILGLFLDHDDRLTSREQASFLARALRDRKSPRLSDQLGER